MGFDFDPGHRDRVNRQADRLRLVGTPRHKGAGWSPSRYVDLLSSISIETDAERAPGSMLTGTSLPSTLAAISRASSMGTPSSPGRAPRRRGSVRSRRPGSRGGRPPADPVPGFDGFERGGRLAAGRRPRPGDDRSRESEQNAIGNAGDVGRPIEGKEGEDRPRSRPARGASGPEPREFAEASTAQAEEGRNCQVRRSQPDGRRRCPTDPGVEGDGAGGAIRQASRTRVRSSPPSHRRSLRPASTGRKPLRVARRPRAPGFRPRGWLEACREGPAPASGRRGRPPSPAACRLRSRSRTSARRSANRGGVEPPDGAAVAREPGVRIAPRPRRQASSPRAARDGLETVGGAGPEGPGLGKAGPHPPGPEGPSIGISSRVVIKRTRPTGIDRSAEGPEQFRSGDGVRGVESGGDDSRTRPPPGPRERDPVHDDRPRFGIEASEPLSQAGLFGADPGHARAANPRSIPRPAGIGGFPSAAQLRSASPGPANATAGQSRRAGRGGRRTGRRG